MTGTAGQAGGPPAMPGPAQRSSRACSMSSGGVYGAHLLLFSIRPCTATAALVRPHCRLSRGRICGVAHTCVSAVMTCEAEAQGCASDGHLQLAVHEGCGQVAQLHPAACCWHRHLPRQAGHAVLHHGQHTAHPWRPCQGLHKWLSSHPARILGFP